MRTKALHSGARAMSSLTKRTAFPDLVRRELASSQSRQRQFGSAMPAPILVWDEFLATKPGPSLTEMRNKASELFGGPEPVLEVRTPARTACAICATAAHFSFV